jgi:Na+(H+)/acetate symporter ActP
VPFEPLGTDEPLAEAPKKHRDFETQIMAGCMTIVLASLITYALAVWPWFTMAEYTMRGLFGIVLAGMLPATVFGVYCTRKFDQAGASGFFGGAMTAGVFMYLRLQQTLLGKHSVDLPAPEYPEGFGWAVPLAWVLFAGAVAWVARPRPKPPSSAT